MLRYRIMTGDGLTRAVTADRSRAVAPPGGSVITEDVEPVGRFGDARVLWADGRISAVTPETSDVAALAGPAAKLLAEVDGADQPDFGAVGGALVVASVRECTAAVVARDPRRTRGGYQSPRVEQLDVVLADGSQHRWFAASVGYSEGYMFSLVLTLDSAIGIFEHVGIDAQLEFVPQPELR